MKKNLFTVLILATSVALSACNDSDNDQSTVEVKDPNANNIQNPVE